MPSGFKLGKMPEAIKLYESGLSLTEVSLKLGISRTGVRNCLKRSGIRRRSAVIGGVRIPENEAIRLYVEEKKTVWEIGDLLGFCGVGIWKCLKRNNIVMRPANPKDRPWGIKKRGPEFRGADGRWWVRGQGSRGSKRRARVVVEKELGIILPSSIHVHHRNENIEDDDPKNLSPLLAGDHSRHHNLGKKNPRKGRPGHLISQEQRNKIRQKALIRWAAWKQDTKKLNEVKQSMSRGQIRRRQGVQINS